MTKQTRLVIQNETRETLKHIVHPVTSVNYGNLYPAKSLNQVKLYDINGF